MNRAEIIATLRQIAATSRSKSEVCRAAAEMLLSDECAIERLIMTNDVLETDNYNLEMNLTHITEELERLREKSRWISVEEKLPDYNDHSYHPIAHNCFCRDIHNNYGFAIFYTPSTDRSDPWITTDGDLDTVLITHWMPLPAPPESEEEG